jgi:hypothetical protein
VSKRSLNRASTCAGSFRVTATLGFFSLIGYCLARRRWLFPVWLTQD